MKRGAIRTLIPLAYKDLNIWPAPEVTALSGDTQRAYLDRRRAVEAYASGTSFDEIRTRTGKGRSEVKRLVGRCLILGPSGQIQGFWALLPGWRARGYGRAKPVRHSKGSGSGGCAGALDQLFQRFPELQLLMHDLYLGIPRKNDALPEARMTIREIHDTFKAELRKLGLTAGDWPFNTSNEGYKSLWQYFKQLHCENAEKATRARSGTDAARRHSVGNGVTPLIPVLRPYSFVQLDFHKVDAASVIVLKNDHGEEFEIPLSRWHFGLLCEEVSTAILGFYVVLALNPSGDDTLEIIQNAIMPMAETDSSVQLAEGNCVVINQLMPELSRQCFAVLKVDNAWCNAANEVVNNIIATVGCAVNFGPTYAWWRRPLIERIFGALTRRGLQRLPSTYGSGPGDTKVDDPNGAARVFRVEVSDLIRLFKRCVREHNHHRSEGLQFMTPLQRLRAALEAPHSGLFSQPLPKSVEKYCPLMMHAQEVTVSGSQKKNVRPHFYMSGHRHTNELLANSWHLIGKKLIAYVDRRLARRVFAVVVETGEQLGLMKVSGAWEDSNVSWRDRQLLIRAGRAARDNAPKEDPVAVLRQEKMAQLAQLPKSQRNRSSQAALELARLNRLQPVEESPPPEAAPPAPPSEAAAHRKPDPFGLFAAPKINLVVRGNPNE